MGIAIEDGDREFFPGGREKIPITRWTLPK
jgi:hypothetical protein